MVRCFIFAAAVVGLFISRFAFADEPAAKPAATPQQVQQTVDKAIAYLQAESGSWLSTRKCAACHHAGMPLWGLAEAERHGYAIDKKYLSETVESILGSHQKLIDSRLFADPAQPPDTRPLARAVKMGTIFMAVAAQSMSLTDAQKQTLKEVTAEAVEKQQADGTWDFFLPRPPINETQMTDIIWTILALQGETTPDMSAAQQAAVEKGIAWLERPPGPDEIKQAESTVSSDAPVEALRPDNAGDVTKGLLGHVDTYQTKVLKLLVAIRTGKQRAELQPRIDELFALQRPDGGWSQIPEWESDAYATGQTLYVLALAGEKPDRPEVARAISFLVATQKPDGSWPMLSRSSNDGRPGSSKLLTPINAASAAWSTMGLAILFPKTQ